MSMRGRVYKLREDKWQNEVVGWEVLNATPLIPHPTKTPTKTPNYIQTPVSLLLEDAYISINKYRKTGGGTTETYTLHIASLPSQYKNTQFRTRDEALVVIEMLIRSVDKKMR